MLSQGTSSKSRDCDGAGVASVSPAALAGSLSYSELAVALDVSGVPLSRSMTVEQIVTAAAAGVTVFGHDNVRTRDAQIRELNRSLAYGLVSGSAYDKARRKLVTAVRRYRLALDLASRVRSTSPSAGMAVAA